jgi:hypothetical protein
MGAFLLDLPVQFVDAHRALAALHVLLHSPVSCCSITAQRRGLSLSCLIRSIIWPASEGQPIARSLSLTCSNESPHRDELVKVPPGGRGRRPRDAAIVPR